MKLTPIGKLVLVILGLAIIFFGIKQFAPGVYDRIIPGAKPRPSQVPPRADLPQMPSSSTSPASNASLPGQGAGCTNLTEVRFLVWAWNAQTGMMLANGGPQATAGSLMCGNGVNLKLIRQDDVPKMQEDLVAFAQELKNGNPNPRKGAHFVAIMGDGAATFLKAINDTLGRLGPDYKAKVVGSAGYSRGEDKFMGPASWKSDPAASRGGLVAGVLRDGDWNIAQKWLGDNGLCNNPDERTFDPDCLNWVNANNYIDASEKYIAGYCENRPVVRKGARTGESKRVCVDSVVTWTPGDVILAQKRGGLVSIVSTKEYASQMPNTIIGIDKWMKSNRPIVEGMLASIFAAGDQIKSNPAALRRGAEISAEVYKEQGADASYWEKYFKGTVERDKQGLMIELGGSSVNNLADNLLLFGLGSGASNLFAATYQVFGDIVVSQYPDLVPSYPPARDIVDTSYIEGIQRRQGVSIATADQPSFSQSDRVKNVLSRRSWQITFESGRATFTAEAQRELEQLLRDLLVASSTVVEVHGHTDSAGNPDGNMTLSEERAFAVKQWLERRSPVNFPAGRVRVFAHGQTNPVASNATPEGRASNRRVEIVLGTTAGG